VLHAVAYWGNENIVQRLLDKRIKIDIRDHHGWTRSVVASVRGHVKIASLLSRGGKALIITNFALGLSPTAMAHVVWTSGITICDDGVTTIADWF
jgi:ankyrin repeat protein